MFIVVFPFSVCPCGRFEDLFVVCCFDFGLFMVYEKAQGDPPRTLRGKSPLVSLSGRL